MRIQSNIQSFILLLVMLATSQVVQAQVFSNEIHYDNQNQDANEKIELAGPPGTSLAGWNIYLYDGSAGTSYYTIPLSGTFPAVQCTVNGQPLSTLTFGPDVAITGIQNGGNAPDGWVLHNGTAVVEFFSYEGSFTATSGPAAGMTSVDIGAVESGSGAATGSIQRLSNNTWATNTTTSTFLSCNSPSQYLPVICVAPSFSACPSSTISTTTAPGACTAVVTYTATATGSPTPALTYSFSGATTGSGSGTGSGSTFNKGNTVVTITATNTCGAPVCIFTITVNDVQAPTISCPANTTANNTANLCSAVVTFTAPVGSDNCPGAVTTQTAGLASGATFPVGITTNVFQVTASGGQTATCAFTVTVTDNQAPTITCPANIAVNNDVNQCSAVVNYIAPVGTDNCSGATTTQTAGLASAAAFPIGVTTNTFRVTAANGQTTTCTFTVTVTDNQAPTITCPANLTVNNDLNQCSAVVNFTNPVGADNCPSVVTIQTTGLASGAAYPVGVTTNTFRVTAANGQTTTCTFTVTVTDNQAPTITCPANLTVNNDLNQCSAVVNFTNPVGADNCPSVVTIQTTGLASGAAYPVGVTTNTFRVTAANGQTSTCTFTVTVTDNQAPTIACPPSISVPAVGGPYILPDFTPQAIAMDNCTPNPAKTQSPMPGMPLMPGVHTITLTATDGVGLTGTCSLTVTITTPCMVPVFSQCPTPIVVSAMPSMCSTPVIYLASASGDPIPVITYSFSGSTIGNGSGTGSGQIFNSGVTNVLLTATNNCGPTTCSFSITVNDPEPPTITCPADITLNNITNLCGGVATYTVPTGIDNCPGATTTQTTGAGSGAPYPVGTTVNTFVVTAANGQTASCSFSVTVVDAQAPVITCPANVNVDNDNNQCSAIVSFTNPVGTDNCPGATTSQTTGLASGSSFPIGVTTNTYVVSAFNGQTATCSFTVTVSDVDGPTITCPANISKNSDPGQCSAPATYTTPVGVDNCPGATTVQTAGLGSGASFPVGTTVNSFMVTAANAQTASCAFTVTVTDNQAPTISCPGNIAVNTDMNQCSAVVTYTTPTGTDNCTGATTTRTAGLAPGAIFPVGVTTNVFRVTDASGQTTTCSFTVTVTDAQAPSIVCPANVNVSADPITCTASGVVLGAPIVSDNCGLAGMATNNGLVTYPEGATTVTWTITDVNGLSSTCDQVVTVASCASTISGAIRWEHDNAPVKDVTVLLQNLPVVTPAGSFLTQANGTYSFTVTSGGDFRVKPGKNLNLTNGLNAADATRIQQHLTSTPPLPGGYKRIAADVNKSNSITTYDATLITQVIAGNPAAMAVFNTSWRFVPASYVFPNPNTPWGFPEKIDLAGVTTSQSNVDFIGVKLGDVNGSGNPQLMAPAQPVVLAVDDRETVADQLVTMTFTAGQFEDIAAFQFALDFDPAVLVFESVQSAGNLDMTDDHFGIWNTGAGEFRAVWNIAKGKTLINGSAIFTLQFKALQSGYPLSEVVRINDDLLHTAAFNTALQETDITLLFHKSQVSGVGDLSGSAGQLQLFQNQPNPFVQVTTAGFYLPQAGDVQLRITDMSGRVVLVSNNYYPAGYHQQELQLKGHQGILNLELITGYGSTSKKLISLGE